MDDALSSMRMYIERGDLPTVEKLRLGEKPVDSSFILFFLYIPPCPCSCHENSGQYTDCRWDNCVQSFVQSWMEINYSFKQQGKTYNNCIDNVLDNNIIIYYYNVYDVPFGLGLWVFYAVAYLYCSLSY